MQHNSAWGPQAVAVGCVHAGQQAQGDGKPQTLAAASSSTSSSPKQASQPAPQPAPELQNTPQSVVDSHSDLQGSADYRGEQQQIRMPTEI